MKKRWWIAGTVVVVLAAGAFGVNQYLTSKIGDEVVAMVNDPDVKKAIEQQIAKNQGQVADLINKQATAVAAASGKGTSSSPATQSGDANSQMPASSAAAATDAPAAEAPAADAAKPSNSSDLSFSSRDEAVAYAKTKFSASEIMHYLDVYRNKSNLSKEEKAAIKAEILSRFSAEELKALQEAASK